MPGSMVLALVHADGEVHAAVGAGLHEAVDQRAVDVDARRPHPLPELAGAVDPGRRLRRPGAGRVQRHEALGEHGERRAAVGRLAEQLDRLVDRGLGVEDHRGGLHGRHANRSELRHGARVPVALSRRARASARRGRGSPGGSSTTRRCRSCRCAGAEHAEVAADLGEVVPEAVEVDGGGRRRDAGAPAGRRRGSSRRRGRGARGRARAAASERGVPVDEEESTVDDEDVAGVRLAVGEHRRVAAAGATCSASRSYATSRRCTPGRVLRRGGRGRARRTGRRPTACRARRWRRGSRRAWGTTRSSASAMRRRQLGVPVDLDDEVERGQPIVVRRRTRRRLRPVGRRGTGGRRA